MLFAFLPPHLLLPGIVVVIVAIVVVARMIRRSPQARRFFDETVGADTPENAVSELTRAKQNAADHRADLERQQVVDQDLATELDTELGGPPSNSGQATDDK